MREENCPRSVKNVKVESVLEQTYPVQEVIIADDCSQDNTEAVVREGEMVVYESIGDAVEKVSFYLSHVG